MPLPGVLAAWAGLARAAQFRLFLNFKFRKGPQRERGISPGGRGSGPLHPQKSRIKSSGACTVFREARGSPKTSSSSPRQRRGRGLRAPVQMCPLLFQLLSSFFNFRRSLLDNRPGRGPQRARSECVSVRLSGASRFPYTFSLVRLVSPRLAARTSRGSRR